VSTIRRREGASDEAIRGFRFPEIPDIKSVLVGDLANYGDWIVANIQTTSYWPVHAQKVPYRGQEVWILPLMNGYFPSVAIKVPSGRPVRIAQGT